MGSDKGGTSHKSDVDRKSSEAAEPAAEPATAKAGGGSDRSIDLTLVPAQLEAAYGAFDPEGAIQPTKVVLGNEWVRSSQRSLLGKPTEQSLVAAALDEEKKKAFDLIDALSRSGALAFDAASLHVLVAATHAFEHTLMETVIAGNVNPIEKLERTSLIVASTVHEGAPAAKLVRGEEHARCKAYVAPDMLA